MGGPQQLPEFPATPVFVPAARPHNPLPIRFRLALPPSLRPAWARHQSAPARFGATPTQAIGESSADSKMTADLLHRVTPPPHRAHQLSSLLDSIVPGHARACPKTSPKLCRCSSPLFGGPPPNPALLASPDAGVVWESRPASELRRATARSRAARSQALSSATRSRLNRRQMICDLEL